MVYKSSINHGGGGSGVGSLNGLTGTLNLTSTGGTITITPSGSTIDLEAIGGGTSTPYSETPSGTVDGTNKVFTLANTPANSAGVEVFLDGLLQRNGIDYTVSGATITFVAAPANGSEIFAFYNTSTGSNSPGGSDGNLQYNNAGAFGGLPGSSIANTDWDINVNKSVIPISSASPTFDGFYEGGGADEPVPSGTVWEALIYSYKIIAGAQYFSTTFLDTGTFTTTGAGILGYTWEPDPNADGYVVFNNLNGEGYNTGTAVDVGNNTVYDSQNDGWPGGSTPAYPPLPNTITLATYLNYTASGAAYGFYSTGPFYSGGGLSDIADLALGTPLTPANGGLGTTNAVVNDLSGSASVDANNRELIGSGGVDVAMNWSSGNCILYANAGLPGTAIDCTNQWLYYTPGRGNGISFDFGAGIMYDTSGNAVLTINSNSLEFISTIYTAGGPFTGTNGQLWNDSTQQTFSAYIDNIRQNFVGCIYTATANSGPSNTATETSLIGAITLPANFWVAKKTVRIEGGGVFTTPASPGSLVIKVKYGTTVIATGTISTLQTSATNAGFKYDIQITCRSSTTLMTVGEMTFDLTASTKGSLNLNNGGSTAAVTTSSVQAIDVTATWSTSTTSTITGTVATIEVLN